MSYYRDDGIILHHGQAADVLATMPGQSIDHGYDRNGISLAPSNGTHLVPCQICYGHGDLPTSMGPITCRYCAGAGTVLVERPDGEGSPC